MVNNRHRPILQATEGQLSRQIETDKRRQTDRQTDEQIETGRHLEVPE